MFVEFAQIWPGHHGGLISQTNDHDEIEVYYDEIESYSSIFGHKQSLKC